MNWTTPKIEAFSNATEAQILRETNLSSLLDEESEFPKINPFFRKNTKLRASNIPFDMTEQEKDIVSDIKKDPKFLAIFCNLTLRDYQEKAIDNYKYKRFNLIVNSRQTGMTKILAIEALYFILSNVDKSIAIYANKLDTSMEIISKIKDLYMDMPYYSKPGVKVWNQKKIEFENGCKIRCHSGKNGSIGYKIDFCIIDGLAHFWKVSEFWKSVFPTIIKNNESKISIVSTPNGDNYFKTLIDSDNTFTKQWITWNQVPNRGEEWKNQEIKNIGSIEAFAQEYELLFAGSKQWDRYIKLEKMIKN